MKQRLIKLWTENVAKYGKYGSIVGYPLLYLVCLVFFASLTFPYDKLKERIVSSFNADQRASGGQQELQIEDMGGYWLSGVRMTGISLLSASDPGKPPSRLVLDSVVVRYGILPMLLGNDTLSFDVRGFGGVARGSFEQLGADRGLDMTIESVDLGAVPPLVSLLGVPLEGTLKGSVHLSLPEGKASKSSGKVALETKGTAIGDGKAKLKGALALPRLEVGTVTFGAEAKEGVLKVTKFVAGGKDLDVQGDGRVTLRDQVTDSPCDIQLRFRINDVYRAKNDLTKSLFGAPGSSAPALFELADPRVKQSKRPDGYYAWNARGPLAKLDFVPGAR